MYLEAGLTVWIVGLGGFVLVRIASGVRRRANVSCRSQNLERPKADQRVALSPPGRPPSGEAAAADDPIRRRSRPVLDREAAVGQALDSSSASASAHRAIADRPSSAITCSANRTSKNWIGKWIRSTAPPQSGSIREPSRCRHSKRRESIRSAAPFAAARWPARMPCRCPKAHRPAGRDGRLLEGRAGGLRALVAVPAAVGPLPADQTIDDLERPLVVQPEPDRVPDRVSFLGCAAPDAVLLAGVDGRSGRAQVLPGEEPVVDPARMSGTSVSSPGG